MSKVKVSSINFANKAALSDECSEVYAANIIGGQWSLAIIAWLMNGKLRFGQLKKLLPGITERMLTLQLRKLEDNKIVTRVVHAEVPPRVECELTMIGYDLRPIIDQLSVWGDKHKELLNEA
jgi:DNA-binding HxlR family transcriptional regulator